MGVAFDLDLGASSGTARRLDAASWLLPAAGLALSACHLAIGPVAALDGPPALRWVLAGSAGLAALAMTVRSVHALRARGACAAPGGRLRVDDDGALLLLSDGLARPMALRASCPLPGLTLLVVAPYPGQSDAASCRSRPLALRIGRDAVPPEHWRRLHVWLRWTERGPPGP